MWYGIIADGVHAHPAAIRIAYKTNFEQLVLVTDAILAMGFKDGRYRFGQQEIEVRGDKVRYIDQCGSKDLRHLRKKNVVRSSDWFGWPVYFIRVVLGGFEHEENYDRMVLARVVIKPP